MSVQSIVDFIESKKDVDILCMNEVGSRAFNLHSDESDHDVYVVFRQPLEEYAQLDTYKQNIREDNLENDWEIQGWNIKRFAELMYKSNPTTMEYITSPLRHYTKNDEFESLIRDFQNYAVENVNPIGLYYHYQSLAKDNYEKYIQDGWEMNKEEIAKSSMGDYLGTMEHDPVLHEVNGEIELSFGRAGTYSIEEAYNRNFVRKTTTERTVKRNLFGIRGICCAKWVKHNKTIPPIDFELLLEKETYLDENVKNQINKLISKKRNNNNENVGVILPEFVESELGTELDNGEYNKGKLDKERVNKFIKSSLQI